MAKDLDLLFGHHLSVLVACVAFSVAKALKMTLPFKRVLQELALLAKTEFVDSFTQLSTISDADDLTRLFQHVPIDPCKPETARADIRKFYNMVFLPREEGVNDLSHNV
eukprot:365720-Chlamydomonas_euryale.AAC.5